MLSSTADAVKALLKADPSLTPADRARIVSTIRNHGNEPEIHSPIPCASAPGILRRGEVAKRFSVTPRAVDNWASAGILEKIRLPGRTRAAGFRESDVIRLIEGRAA